MGEGTHLHSSGFEMDNPSFVSLSHSWEPLSLSFPTFLKGSETDVSMDVWMYVWLIWIDA